MRGYGWTGLDDPDRRDRAVLDVGSDRMRGHGTSISPATAIAWSLTVAPGWVTRRLAVTAHGADWWRSLVLERDGEGRWAGAVRCDGPDGGLPAAGIADPRELDGALDCDLGLCPVTNTMPIRRLGLPYRAADEVLLMAFVEVPSLRVVPALQRYTSGADGGVVYRSVSSGFTANLSVDDDGVVVDYEYLARRTA